MCAAYCTAAVTCVRYALRPYSSIFLLVRLVEFLLPRLHFTAYYLPRPRLRVRLYSIPRPESTPGAPTHQHVCSVYSCHQTPARSSASATAARPRSLSRPDVYTRSGLRNAHPSPQRRTRVLFGSPSLSIIHMSHARAAACSPGSLCTDCIRCLQFRTKNTESHATLRFTAPNRGRAPHPIAHGLCETCAATAGAVCAGASCPPPAAAGAAYAGPTSSRSGAAARALNGARLGSD